MAIEYDLQKFHDGLAEHGLIIPVGVPGAFGRGAVHAAPGQPAEKKVEWRLLWSTLALNTSAVAADCSVGDRRCGK